MMSKGVFMGERVYETIMPPKSGLAVEVMAGQHLRVTSLEGQQVVDMVIFNLRNLGEVLSTSYSRSRQTPKVPGHQVTVEQLTTGHVLLSTLARPMMTITADTVGVNTAVGRMCDRSLYEIHGIAGKDGCLQQIGEAVKPYGLGPQHLPDAFDLFEEYYYDPDVDGWVMGPEPVGEPGDYIEFRAEYDVLVGMSNCPDDVLTNCNAKHCTPMKVEVFG